MKTEAFIFNWKGHEARALALQTKIEKIVKTTVINSEEHLDGDHAGWVNLDDAAYFSARWNMAVKLLNAEVLFHIQADADFDDFETVIKKAELIFTNYRPGVYEPNVDYTSITYDRQKLQPVEPDLYEVPKTDCTCWFIAADVARALPPVDVTINKFGWGIPRVIAALSQLDGRSCLRDYGFTIRHPKGRGYSTTLAKQQLQKYVETLSPNIREKLDRIEQISSQLALQQTSFSNRMSVKRPG